MPKTRSPKRGAKAVTSLELSQKVYRGRVAADVDPQTLEEAKRAILAYESGMALSKRHG